MSESTIIVLSIVAVAAIAAALKQPVIFSYEDVQLRAG